MSAVRTGLASHLHHNVRALVQPAGVAPARTAWLGRERRPVRLEAPRGRRGGVIGRLGRGGEPGLDFGEPGRETLIDGCQRRNLRKKRDDQRLKLAATQVGQVRRRGHP